MFRILNFIILIIGLGFLALRLSVIAAIAQFLPIGALTPGSTAAPPQPIAARAAPHAAPLNAASRAPAPYQPPPVHSPIYQACAARPGANADICGCFAVQTQELTPPESAVLAQAVRRARGADAASIAEALIQTAPNAPYRFLARAGEAFARAAAACLGS